MFLKTGIKINDTSLKLEGKDVVYIAFGSNRRVRFVAAPKLRTEGEDKKVIVALLEAPGGTVTMLRSEFEKEYTEETQGAAVGAA